MPPKYGPYLFHPGIIFIISGARIVYIPVDIFIRFRLRLYLAREVVIEIAV
jgi:hypothetical protein